MLHAIAIGEIMTKNYSSGMLQTSKSRHL